MTRFLNFWELPSGAARRQAKQDSEDASDRRDERQSKKECARVSEVIDDRGHAYIGDSKIRWSFDPHDELSRRMAFAMSLSSFAYLRSNISPRESRSGWLDLFDRRSGERATIRTPSITEVRSAFVALKPTKPNPKK